MSHGLENQNQYPEPHPALTELLRTCMHPPVLLLRVEHIIRKRVGDTQDEPHTSKEHNSATLNSNVTKFFLTDGELLIQALPHRKLSSLGESQNVIPGDLVEIYNFDVKKSRRRNGKGHVVYLGIKNCRFIICSSNRSSVTGNGISSEQTTSRKRIRTLDDLHKYEDGESIDEDKLAGGFIRVDDGARPPLEKQQMEQAPIQPRHIDAQDVNTVTDAVGNRDAAGVWELQYLPITADLKQSTTIKQQENRLKRPLEASSDDEDAFETIPLNRDIANKRRRALHELSQNTAISFDNRTLSKVATSSRPSSSRSTITDIIRADTKTLSLVKQTSIPDLSRDLTSSFYASAESSRPTSAHRTLAAQSDTPPLPQQFPEPPFHTLHSILHPPPTTPLPRKNYTFTTLAIVTYVGPTLITKPNTPFPPKRHIKIEDPSLHTTLPSHPTLPSSNQHRTPASDKRGKGITVAIYQDAATFKPSFGTLALFRGLVMQRLSNGDVILNVYPRKKKTDASDVGLGESVAKDQGKAAFGEGEWFVDDQERLEGLGFDVGAVAEWWNRRKRELGIAL